MKQYLDLIKTVLTYGDMTPQRAVVNGKPVGQLVVPGLNFRHDMKLGFPLLTTKKVPMRLVAAELEWFISGSTDKKRLQELDVHIWDDWGFPDGSLGPVYGAQWRHYSHYVQTSGWVDPDCKAESRGPTHTRFEIDQFKNLVEGVRKDPYSRRHRVTAWNPAEIDQMALPTCHTEWQTVVTGPRGSGKLILNLCMNQRSADMMLGVPFNIASYALLLLLLAKELGMDPGILDIKFVNAHIYENHIEAAKEQIERTPRILPEIMIPEFVSSGDLYSIYKWTHKDFSLFGYNPLPALKMDVAV